MTFAELVERVANRAGVPASTARRVIVALREEITAAVIDGERVRIPDLGSFDSRLSSQRTVRDIRSRRRIPLDARHVPVFRAASALRTALRDRTPQLLRDPAHRKAWSLAQALLGDLEMYNPDTSPDLTSVKEPEAVERACEAAFGDAWSRARTTFDASVPAEVRAARDHLIAEAAARWASS